jgi:hypothetical protein
VNWLSGCGFIDAGRCMTGGYSQLTMQIDGARNHAHESAPISFEKFSNLSPEGGLS